MSYENEKKQKKKYIIAFCVVAVISIASTALLVYQGVIIPNELTSKEYAIRGVDVSSYQGEIDWDVLADQDISFAFIKATEGSEFVDPCFEANWGAALKTPLRVGAYHFFSYDSSGKTQAENFIKTVPNVNWTMPPVVDVEFYGDKKSNLPNAENVQNELVAFLDEIEKHYGKKPIIYATEKSYKLYIAGELSRYDIWIRDVITTPTLSDNKAWTFWQYTDKESLTGYNGEEKFIDMNVFFGTKGEFNRYGRS